MSVNPKGIIEKVVLSLFFLLAGFNPGNTCTVLSMSCFLLSLFRHKDSSHCSTLILKEENLGPFGAHQVQKFWRFQINSTHETFLLNWRSWLNLNIQQVGLQPFPERRKLGPYWSSQSPDEKQGNLFQGKPFSKHVPGLFQFRSCIHVKKTFLHYLSDII